METTEQGETAGGLSDAEHLRLFLRDRDVMCPLCSYNLRGLTAGRCPECGRELRLSVGLTEPFLRAWIMLAVGVFASAGIGILFILLVMHLGWPGRLHGYGDAALVYFMASPILIFPTLRWRRQFLRLSKTSQWTLAGHAVGLTVLAIIAFAATLR